MADEVSREAELRLLPRRELRPPRPQPHFVAGEVRDPQVLLFSLSVLLALLHVSHILLIHQVHWLQLILMIISLRRKLIDHNYLGNQTGSF